MRIFIIAFLLLVACKPAPVEESKQDQLDFAALALRSSQMTLIGNAQKKALDWNSFQNLLTGLENYDHSIPATNKLIDHVNDMLENPIDDFVDQAIISRLIVLKTRLHIYKSYLGYRIKESAEIEKKYNDIILALDELVLQINWKINEFDQPNKTLLEILKADLEAQKNDSIPTTD
ncbi:hypothetical protein LX97_03287 [Nonlabens dokdonensis]|uniref:Uncharacterized protein n=2 Tax=Nonlabens dokdonensis TaxID=328515 RepID=L7WDG0_NONDD|nr:hypothetical protein [Nonlabens dokdonensis]AGC76918.1 hypothetical protein DDD_1791 [Nonlabens dokdonensis DSW-6]PZX36824.1 hypothetical protein LX97_03287 [Nonlabens dokdonensis]